MPQKAEVKGFVLPEQTAKLVFEGDFAGAEVTVRLDVPLGMFMAIQDHLDKDAPMMVLGVFANAALVGWNLQDRNKQPIPAGLEGIKQIPIRFASLIINEWMKAVQAVPGPLGEPSGNGSMSGES